MSFVRELVEIYEAKEPWHEKRMSREEALVYHDFMLKNGAISIATEGNVLCGYIEVWRVSFEQLGKLLCGKILGCLDEDLFSGPIAYVANLWIKEGMRGSWVMKDLRLKFLEKHNDCKYICGERGKGLTASFRIFRRAKIEVSQEAI